MKKYLIIAVVISSLFACKDVFEEDIAPQKVVLVAPKDNDTTVTLTQLLYWNKVPDAIQYVVQIAKPSFAAPSQFLLDSTVATNSFQYTFTPGTYQWRVKAINGSSETAYTTRTITVIASSDLSQQKIVLSSPTENYVTNVAAVTFKWDTLPFTTRYNFILKQTDFNGTIITEKSVTTNDISETLTEGIFAWGVQAENETTKSTYTSRTITIDVTKPNVPTLKFPVDTTFKAVRFNYTWSRGTETGTKITDSLFVATDSLFKNTIRQISKIDSSYADSLGIGTYFWRVFSKDAATNKSDFSNTKKFIIN